MKFSGPLIVVKDMEKSKRFYKEIFGLEIVSDFGANVTFSGPFSLQTKETWQEFIGKPQEEILEKSNNFELYFEVNDLDRLLETLRGYPEIEYVHDVVEYSWGQRGIRFYDPDGNILEVGENMEMVTLRLVKQGMPVEDVAEKTMSSVEQVRLLLKKHEG
ncbi:MAG: VOC family protein [Christensenellaceae bacterium]|jgi:lactoylglutathione lyase